MFSRITAQLAALKSELNADPRGYGYQAGFDQLNADRLNTIRDGTNPPTNPLAAGGVAGGAITVKRPDVSVDELMEAIDARDLSAVNSLQQEYFQILLSRPQVQLLNADGSDTRRWTNLKLGITNTNASQTRIAALATRKGSRAEELFGVGTILSPDDAVAARNS